MSGRRRGLLEQALGGPVRAVRDRRRRAGTLGRDAADVEAVLRALDAGTVPPAADLAAAVAAAAGAADTALATSGPAAAAAPLTTAAAVAFHRTLHFDGTSSLLVDDPGVLLDPLRRSRSWRLVTARRHAGRPLTGARRRPDGPHRLLLVSYRNWTFLDPVVQEYTGRDDVEVRRLELAELPGLPLSPLQQLRLRLTGLDDARATRWGAALGEALDWADTVLLDWLQRGAVLLTALDPHDTRVVVRLHSFEAFTVFPHLVDHDRVDDLVVVGPHLGRLLDRLVPAAAAPRRHVVPNLADLARFDAGKDDDARFTLAVVGYGVVAKDPLWAVELLARLRDRDDRYRLLLVGADLDADGPAGTAAYRRRLEHRLAAPDVAGAVERVPFTTDVPALLRRVGVVVSSSVRESFHLALVEGAASGAVPVVRRWPLFAAVGGPEDLFPADWAVSDVGEAAERVRRLTADPAVWRRAGRDAAAFVRARYDVTVTRPAFDRLLLGPDE